MAPSPGIDIPEAFNAFAQLVLAPLGIAVVPLAELPPDRHWSELMDEHKLREQWTAYVVALTRAQALARAPTIAARARLQREFGWHGSVQAQRMAFAMDLKRVLLGDLEGTEFCSVYCLPPDKVEAVIDGASKSAGHIGLAAQLSVAFCLFGDGRAKDHFKRGTDTQEKKLERARDAFKKAIEAARSFE